MTASRTGKHVLIVDDDRAILGLVEHWLTAAGYSVVACDRFETAKQHLADAQPDVLLTDVRLGAFNGLQLVILAKEMGPHTAVVMSAFDDPMLELGLAPFSVARQVTAESGPRRRFHCHVRAAAASTGRPDWS